MLLSKLIKFDSLDMENSEEFKKKMYEFFFVGPKESSTKDHLSKLSSKHLTNTSLKTDFDSDTFSNKGAGNHGKGGSDEDEKKKRL